MGAVSPQTLGGTAVSLYIYVEDVDSFTEKALAKIKSSETGVDQFYGDRSGHFEDPFGHHWGFATHKEDLTPAELDERAKAALARKSVESGGYWLGWLVCSVCRELISVCLKAREASDGIKPPV